MDWRELYGGARSIYVSRQRRGRCQSSFVCVLVVPWPGGGGANVDGSRYGPLGSFGAFIFVRVSATALEFPRARVRSAGVLLTPSGGGCRSRTSNLVLSSSRGMLGDPERLYEDVLLSTERSDRTVARR